MPSTPSYREGSNRQRVPMTIDGSQLGNPGLPMFPVEMKPGNVWPDVVLRLMSGR